MKRAEKKPAKEVYEQMRNLSCKELWEKEVPLFNAASAQERGGKIGLIRAVGVVFARSQDAEEKARVKKWLGGLLNDPDERIRRYAVAALPKLGAGQSEEVELLGMFKNTQIEREKKFLGQALEKIGGVATLKQLGSESAGLRLQSEQKLKASIARTENPSSIRTDQPMNDLNGLRIHLHGRYGLEQVVREEVEEFIKVKQQFRIAEVRSGLVILTPLKPFTLEDIHQLRCFGHLGFPLGTVRFVNHEQSVESLAGLITSSLARRIFKTFTKGSIRYRLDFTSKGHQRAAVRQLAERAYTLCPEILNDAQSAPWLVAVRSTNEGDAVELCPKLTPDPRFTYRQEDVPAASHPPLAACLARLAGKLHNAVVWDPFCGSGLELIERTLLGGVAAVYGTDRSEEAIKIIKANFDAAKPGSVRAKFVCCDFRDFERMEKLGRNSINLIITNPPMGKRVPVANLEGLLEDLFSVAAAVLQPGGKLVLANPMPFPSRNPGLKLQFRNKVDFSGFDTHVEVYVKTMEAGRFAPPQGRSKITSAAPRIPAS